MAQFLALITTFDQGLRPDNTLPVPPPGWDTFPKPMPQPPYPSQGPGFPTHPIAPGGTPPGIWGGPPLYPDQGLPGQPPYPSQGPGFPTHPIAPGGQPPGIWGGGNVPMPSPPIYFPPEGSGGTPSHPIVLPPDLPEEIPDVGPVDWKVGWTAQTGWIVVGVPNNPVPTPSR